MLPGYHTIFNGHGYNMLLRELDIPDPDLGVGFAEIQDPLPSLARYQYVNRPRIIKEQVLTVDKSQLDGTGKPIHLDQFPKSGWMGDGIGGIF